MQTTSKTRSAIIVGVLVAGSLCIAAAGIFVGQKALNQTAVFSARCEALQAENALLRVQLEEVAALTKGEAVCRTLCERDW